MEHDDLVILDEKKNVIFSSFPIQIVQNFFENPLSEIKNYEITELDGKSILLHLFCRQNWDGSIIIFQII